MIDKDNPIISLREADLEGADLNYMDLSNAYLPFVTLTRANLDHTNLEDADLGGAHLKDAYLGGANLSNANLASAYLNDAELVDANLDSAYLNVADLSGTHLEDTNLSGAYLGDVTLGSVGIGRGAFLLSGIGVTDNLQVQRTRAFGLATMPNGKVHPGHYVTDEFVRTDGSGATLSFIVGEGWERDVSIPASSGELYLNGPGEGLLIFTRPVHAYERGNMSRAKEAPAPKDLNAWVSWFQDHPNLEHSKPVPVSVGGEKGVEIDVWPISGLENYPRDFCGEELPCVPLYKGSDDESALAVYEGWKDRLVILDVEGETVIIDISATEISATECGPEEFHSKVGGETVIIYPNATECEFNVFHLMAQHVLDTVEWRSP